MLARTPELCLIDELAHTNAPGVEHEKRYEDVRDVLDAGIDVFSTVNVQHLESLNDQVSQLTGAHVRETIPDEVLSAADEVVLIDLTPEALIGRLRAGKVYPPERVAGGAEQLLQDREPRGAARDGAAPGRRGRRGKAARARADADRAPRRGGLAAAAEAQPQAIAERLLALATLDAALRARRAARVALGAAPGRRARRAASCARPGDPPSREDRERLESLRRLAAMLGARLRVEEGEDVAAVAISVARELGATYMLIGTPSARRGIGRLGLRGGGARRLAARAPAARAAGRRRADRRRPDAARRAGPPSARRADADGPDD